MYRIGIDIGGSHVAVGVLDKDNNFVASAHTPTRKELGGEAMVQDIIGCIDNALLLAGISPSECDGIGIGCPGSCNSETGVVNNAHNLGWYNFDICRIFREEYGLPTYLANDADCAALGETVAGAAKGSSNVIMITLGTGLGGGCIIGGKIHAGTKSLGGEWGHSVIKFDGEFCTCGRQGCWEAYAASSALVHQAARAAQENPDSILAQKGELNGVKIFEAYDEGDAVTKKVIEQYGQYVAIGLVNLCNTLYPEKIIVGGGISAQGDKLLNPIRDYFYDHLFVGKRDDNPPIVPAVLGNSAGIVGAAALVKTA